MRWLDAAEAAEALGVQRETLYAYVSRGWIKSEPVPGRRARRYSAADIERLKDRQTLHRAPADAVGRALDWGTPVLDSALTDIRDDGPHYRGVAAVQIAGEWSLEEVAGLLWTGERRAVRLQAPDARPDRGLRAAVDAPTGALRAFDRFATTLPWLAAADPAAWDLRPEGVRATGARIVGAMVQLSGACGEGTVAERIASGLGRAEAGAIVSAALVLCADHELNVSSFTARCVASARATPWDAVLAALGALRGARHGGECDRVEALLAEVDTGGVDAVSARLRRGERLPGFEHRLYPDGDPRAHRLLELARAAGLELAPTDEVAATVERLLGLRPTIDFALVAVTRALGLPAGTAIAWFAIGRSVGWIGHVLEQLEDDRMIRPRARYVGP